MLNKNFLLFILILNLNTMHCGKKELEAQFIEAAKNDLDKITQFISEYVVTKKISIDAKDEEGLTALAKAIMWNNKSINSVLLAHGANPNEKMSNASRFSTTADWDYRNETILTWSAKWSTKEFVELLINNKADVNKSGLYNMTPLMNAASSGKIEIIELLLSKGADISLTDKWGYNAIIHATLNGHDNVVEFLLKHTNDINQKDKDRTSSSNLKI